MSRICFSFWKDFSFFSEFSFDELVDELIRSFTHQWAWKKFGSTCCAFHIEIILMWIWSYHRTELFGRCFNKTILHSLQISSSSLAVYYKREKKLFLREFLSSFLWTFFVFISYFLLKQIIHKFSLNGWSGFIKCFISFEKFNYWSFWILFEALKCAILMNFCLIVV